MKRKEAAKKYWTDHGRANLLAEIENQASQFRDHHVSHGKTMADWPAAWRTWIRNAIKFSKPTPKGAAPPPTSPADDLQAWGLRLEWFHFGRPADNFDNGVPVGHWEASKWGPKPGQDGCKVPADAERNFARKHPVRAVQ